MKPKYIPDMATVMRETDPAKRRGDRARALVDRPTPPMFWQRGKGQPGSASPWSKDGAEAIDKAALPSAMGPRADAAEVTKAAVVDVPAGVPRWRQSWRVVAACAALGLTVLLAVLLIQVAKPPAVKVAPTGARVMSPAAGARVGVGVMPSTTATEAPSVTAVEPSATASSAPRVSAPATRAIKPSSKAPGERGDPYDAAPAPPATSAPTAAPGPEKPAGVQPTPTPTPKATSNTQDPGLNE